MLGVALGEGESRGEAQAKQRSLSALARPMEGLGKGAALRSGKPPLRLRCWWGFCRGAGAGVREQEEMQLAPSGPVGVTGDKGQVCGVHVELLWAVELWRLS